MKTPENAVQSRGLRVIGWIGPAALGLVLGLFFGKSKEPVSATEKTSATSSPDAATERLKLSQLASKRNPIETAEAKRIRLAKDVELVGSVSYDADHFAQVGPLIAGRIVSLEAGIGDTVKAGQVMAALESADVGQAQAAYLTARAAVMASQANLRRERELAERRVSSVREKELAEA